MDRDPEPTPDHEAVASPEMAVDDGPAVDTPAVVDAGAVVDNEHEIADDRDPLRFNRWMKRSATGAVMTGISLGLREALEHKKNEPALMIEASGQPDDPNHPIRLHFDPDSPSDSVAVIRQPGDRDSPSDND